MYSRRREQRAVGADAGAAGVRLANRAAGWHGRVYSSANGNAKQLKQTAVQCCSPEVQRRRLQKSVRVRRRLVRASGCRGPARVDQKELLCCCFRMGDLAVAIGLPGAASRAGGARPTRRPLSESASSKRLASPVQRSRKVRPRVLILAGDAPAPP